MSTGRRLEKDDKYALSKIGKDSVYSYFVIDSRAGWVVALFTLGLQVTILIFFVVASEVDLRDYTKIDILFNWKCTRDTDKCTNYSFLSYGGWFIFSGLMIVNLAKDWINGSKLIYHSSRVRHPIGARIQYFIGGISMCSIALFALYVSFSNDSLLLIHSNCYQIWD